MNILILRGTNSAGKSTFANLIKSFYPETIICSADDYFIKNGIYEWEKEKIGHAHH